MALTILSTPTTPNVTGTNLLYTISSSIVPEFQYRYVVDIYESGSSTRLTRLKYPENLNGTANIDLGRVLDDYTDYDYNWKTVAETGTNYDKNFTVKFGEEYANSYTGPVTTYPDIISSNISVFKGNIQYPTVASSSLNGIYGNLFAATSSINFNNTVYNANSAFPSTAYYSEGRLTNNPRSLSSFVQSKYFVNGGVASFAALNAGSGSGIWVVRPTSLDDYGTSTYLTSASVGIPNFVDLEIFNDSGTKIWDSRVAYQSLNNRSLVNMGAFSSTSGSLTIGTGLANFKNSLAKQEFTSSFGTDTLENTISSSAQWNYYCVSIGAVGSVLPFEIFYNEDKGANFLIGNTNESGVGVTNPSIWYNGYYPTKCNNEKTRFAFINSFGTWDYYNVYMPTRRVTNIDRQTYDQSNIKLQQQITTYNVSDRGTTQYYTEYTDEFEITTDTLDSQQSQWLRELFESDDVYIQSGSDFIPIIITNSSEQLSNNTYRNKNFRYTIRYQFSNLREPR